MNFRNFLLAGAFLLPVAAQAQAVNGYYVSAGVGPTFEQQRNISAGYPLMGVTGQLRTNAGWAGEVSGGFGFGNGLRTEIEGLYLNNQYKGAQAIYAGRPVLPFGAASAGGRDQKYGAFANALYDFNIGNSIVYPYVGLGVGWLDDHENAVAGYYGNYARVSGDRGSLAGQAIVGLSFPISGVPGLSATVDYRAEHTFGADHAYNASVDGVPVYGVDVQNSWNHTVLFGLRYAFGVTPPPPPAPAPVVPPPAPAPVATPAPAPARTYLVFFDWDKADLTDKARSIIADAAQASTKVQTTQIEVNGYTDLSGTPAYNQGLSVRRAKAVAAELVRLGVPRTEIEIMGYGESDPLVPTAPGVREPQNRRVEIILK